MYKITISHPYNKDYQKFIWSIVQIKKARTIINRK